MYLLVCSITSIESLAGFRVLFDFVGARGVFSSINETFSPGTFWTFTRRSTCSCRVSTSLAIRRRGQKRFFPQNRTRTLPRVSPLHRAFPHTLRSLSLDCKSGARQCGLPDGAVASCTCRHACPRAPSARTERGIRVMPGGAREG